MCVCVCVCQMARLQVVCVASLTSDDSLESKAAQDSLAVRRAASADVDSVCVKSVSYIAIYIHLSLSLSQVLYRTYYKYGILL